MCFWRVFTDHSVSSSTLPVAWDRLCSHVKVEELRLREGSQLSWGPQGWGCSWPDPGLGAFPLLTGNTSRSLKFFQEPSVIVCVHAQGHRLPRDWLFWGCPSAFILHSPYPTWLEAGSGRPGSEVRVPSSTNSGNWAFFIWVGGGQQALATVAREGSLGPRTDVLPSSNEARLNIPQAFPTAVFPALCWEQAQGGPSS